MPLNSWAFIIYTVITLLIYWLIPKNTLRTYFLILAGFIFVIYHFPINFLIYLIFAFIIFILAMLILRFTKRVIIKKIILILGIFLSVGFLSFYKYRTFLAKFFLPFFDLNQYTQTDEFYPYIIPIGISFLIFEAIQYLIEVYRSNITKNSLKDFLLFIFFFPTITAGPIKRYKEFQEQIKIVSFPSKKEFFNSIKRIILGMAKKIIIVSLFIEIPNVIFKNFGYFLLGIIF